MYRLEANVHIPAGHDFPSDMLRYDVCFPKDTAAVLAIGSPVDSFTVVTVVQYSDVKRGYWTPARWDSFGVRLEPLPKETRKV